MNKNELEKYHESLLDLFSTEGWKSFIEDINGSFKAEHDNCDTECDTNDKWQYRRGSLSVLRRISNYEEFIRQSIESTEHQEDLINDDI